MEKKKAKKRKPQRLPDVLEERELETLLEAPSRKSIMGLRARSILALMGRYGLRVSEVCNLQMADLNLDAEDPYIRVIGKGDKERRAWIGNGTLNLLTFWLEKRPKGGRALFPVVQHGKRFFGEAQPGRAVSPRWVCNMVDHFAKKAGIEKHVHPHTLRHTCATIAIRKGEGIPAVRDMLGHANVSTTSIYTHTAGRDLSAMARRLDPGKSDKQADVSGLSEILVDLSEEKRKALIAFLEKKD